MHTLVKYAILPTALAATLAATNPGEADHRRAAVDQVSAVCSAGDKTCIDKIKSIERSVYYDDCLLFSTARVGEVETLGILGRVVRL